MRFARFFITIRKHSRRQIHCLGGGVPVGESIWGAGIARTDRARVRLHLRVARSLVQRRLHSLEGGRIHFQDPLGEWTAGKNEATGDGLETHVHVRDMRFYRSLAFGGTMGAAESYLREQ